MSDKDVVVTGVRYELPLMETPKRRDIQCKEHFLILYNTFMTYKIVGTYSIFNDDTAVWEEKIFNYRWTRLREGIVEVNMYRNHDTGLYNVEVDFASINEPLQIGFAKGKEAKGFYDSMQNYFLLTKAVKLLPDHDEELPEKEIELSE